MTQSAASGSSAFSTDSRNVVGIGQIGFDGTNVTVALPSPLISAAVTDCGIKIVGPCLLPMHRILLRSDHRPEAAQQVRLGVAEGG